MTARVLLTGATGFVGFEVAHALDDAGYSLCSLVRGHDAQLRFGQRGLPGEIRAGALEDAAAVRAAVAGVDVVVHLAALVDPALQGDPTAVTRVNRDRTIELARVAASAGARRFVFMSSIAAMGFWSGIATSESACCPATSYGRAKREAELALLGLRGPGFDVVVLRPPTIYGRGETYNFLEWVRAVDRGLFRVIGDGDNCFPLATTRNVARATVTAVGGGGLSSGVFLVADREPYTMNRIHDAIIAALGRRKPRVRIPTRLAAVAGLANEALSRASPRIPSVLTRARVRTLTVDQRFDVEPLLRAGVPLDAPLEEWVRRTIRDQQQRGLLDRPSLP